MNSKFQQDLTNETNCLHLIVKLKVLLLVLPKLAYDAI